MGYFIWTMTLLLVGTCQMSGSEELKDFLVVYRTPYETSWPPANYVEKIKEYHLLENRKDLLFKIDDEYIDSVEGMVPLNCAPATETCQWELSGSWESVAVNITEDRNFTIDIGEVDQGKRCTSNDFPRICYENGQPRYYCSDSDKDKQFSGNVCFTVDPEKKIVRTPTIIDHSYNQEIMVLPLKNAQTCMVINTAPGYSYRRSYHHYMVYVNEMYESLQEREILQLHNSFRTGFIKSHHLLKILPQGTSQYSLYISYTRDHLALAENHGSLSYEILPVSDRICVSVVYTTRSRVGYVDIKFNVMFSNGTTYEVSKYNERQFGDWKMRTFNSLVKMAKGKVKMQLDVSGKGTILHSIFACNPNGQKDLIVVEKGVSLPESIVQLQDFKDSSGKCLNGGVYSADEKICICPEGFTGDSCEEGCGPYYFGHNCSRDCSNFATGCRGMMFCKQYLSCRCAAGFQGKFCENDCGNGFYGASCIQRCGYCNNNVCNRFTGYCDDDCRPGFRRPFCQIPYTYSRISPEVTYQDMNVVRIEINADDVEGEGEREYYQIQYRENEEISWTELQPQKLRDTSITSNISNLLPGVEYRVRVIYIDKDGNSYQRQDVPTTSFYTLCSVPTSMNYNLTATSTTSFIVLDWKYDTNKTDCPITGYTIVLRRHNNEVHHNVSGNNQSLMFQSLLPGVSYEVKIKAHTSFGDGPFSTPLIVKTIDEAPLQVSNLKVTEGDSRKLRVSWKPPRFPGGSLQEYLVKYKCIRLLACERSSCSDEKQISVPANQNYAILEDLQPHAKYYIRVAARSASFGPYTSFTTVTKGAAPDAAPEMSESPIVTSTNVTIGVQWLPLKSCTFLNGYLLGYGYTLFSENRTVLQTGNTTKTHVAFDDLTPQASYFVHVHAISTGGWNTDKELVINASTAASVPEKVQNLSIYKRGRRVIGVRWAQPIHSYGELESFSISYCKSSDCENAITKRLPPVPCVPWPALFCHTISSLSPNTQYSVSVRARNIRVSEYGEAATVNTVTSEGAPEAPTSLSVSARTSHSVTLEWEPPRMFNGILRSYLVNVEQLDSANSSNCCVYSPLLEVPVKSEDRKYKHEVTDLMPASKYIISVSAKTVSIGPSASLTLSTSPETPKLMQGPKLLDNNRVKLPRGKDFPGINGTYVLLVLLPTGNSTSLIWNSEVGGKLCSLLPTRSFYIVEEYSAEVMKSSLEEEEETEYLEVEIGKGMGPRNGTIGVLDDPVLPSNFRVGLALILDYNGAVSVGFTLAEEVIKSGSELKDDLA